MTSTISRSVPVAIPVPIPSNSSKDVSCSSDEDNTDFVGTPYCFDRSNLYEYPIPTSASSIPVTPPSNSTRLPPSSASLPLSNTVPTLSFLAHNSPSASSSRSSCSSIVTPPSKPSPTHRPPSPRGRRHSRLPSAIAMNLKLDMPAPIPPNLIGRNLGALGVALGLEPGEPLTSEKASMLSWRERLDGPSLHPVPVVKKAGH